MSRRAIAPHRRHGRGVVAVELALILPLFVALLALPLFFGRAFYHYDVAYKAAHDAARYLASVPAIEMKNAASAAAELAVAQGIVAEEIAELNPGSPTPPKVAFVCGNDTCDLGNLPSSVTATVSIRLFDGVFSAYTDTFTGDTGFPLTASVVMPYVGN